MEAAITAPVDGVVQRLALSGTQPVEGGDLSWSSVREPARRAHHPAAAGRGLRGRARADRRPGGARHRQREIEEEDLLSEWQRRRNDLGSSSVAVLDGERIVAYAEHMGEERYDAAVHPSYRGRASAPGSPPGSATRPRAGIGIVGMPVPEGSDGDRLLTALGHDVRWTSWCCGSRPARRSRPALPEGYLLREATPGTTSRCGRSPRTPS